MICPDCKEKMVKSWIECDDGSGWYCGWLCGCKPNTKNINKDTIVLVNGKKK